MKRKRHTLGVRRIVSGGQTGVDRAALDAALRLGIEHGGWCPHGRLAEDGVIPKRYRLRQTVSAEYPVRTERNVVDSDATLILYRQRISGGTRLTRHLAQQHGKPLLVVNLHHGSDEQAVRDWITAHDIRVLNVAGPRESSAPGIGQQAQDFLHRVFADEPATD
jgi:hypothetical protein